MQHPPLAGSVVVCHGVPPRIARPRNAPRHGCIPRNGMVPDTPATRGCRNGHPVPPDGCVQATGRLVPAFRVKG